MDASIQFDKRSLQKLVDQCQKTGKAVGMTVQWMCQDAMRLALNDAIKYTAPRGAAKVGGWKEQERIGKGAVVDDLMGKTGAGPFQQRREGIFNYYPSDAGKEYTGKDKPMRIIKTKDGRTYVCDMQLYRPDASMAEMEAHHLKHRRKDGRVTMAGSYDRYIGRSVSKSKMMVKKERITAYIASVHDRVGSLKAGWMYAAEMFAGVTGGRVSAPAWVRKHTSAGSIPSGIEGIDKDGNGILSAKNNSHHNGAIRNDMLEYIMKKQNKNLEFASEKRIQQVCDSFNKGMATGKPVKVRSAA